MKGKNKGKVQYVQEFRKITAIQKLPTLKEGFGDLFFQNKAQNNKFLRLKDEPFLSEIEINSRTHELCDNQYVQEYICDTEQQCKAEIQSRMKELNEEIMTFKDWAGELTNYVDQGKYVYRFKTHKASPPVALAKEMLTLDPLAIQLASESAQREAEDGKSKLPDSFNESVNLNKKPLRFDFNKITEYLITDDFKLQDLQGNIDLAKREIQTYRPYKNIEQINSIKELNIDYQKFEYHLLDIQDYNKKGKNEGYDQHTYKKNSSFAVDDTLNNPSPNKKKLNPQLPQLLQPSKSHYQKFKYLSVLNKNLDITINYFRNLGPPSRNPQNFIKNIILEDTEEHILQEDEQNPLAREKIDTCLLHFLEPSELKVNKNTLNFNDMLNITMTRITSTNAHMCIRSQKVTRLQYEKLLKKMEKLYKLQHEDGKTRVNQAVTTDQVEEDANKGSKNDNSPNSLSLNKIVQQINAIRKEAYGLQKKSDQEKPYQFINQRLVRDEMSRKMFSLLQELYKRVCEQLPFNYSILQIGLHVNQVNGLAQEQYEKKKLIWFIMTILEEIEKGKSQEKNINFLQNQNKKEEEPRVLKFKGDKLIAKEKMGTKNLYYNNPVANSTIREKSVSQNTNLIKLSASKKSYPQNQNSTPLKTNSYNRTPQKIQSKSPLKSNINTQTQNKRTTTPTKNQPLTSPLPLTTAKKPFKF